MKGRRCSFIMFASMTFLGLVLTGCRERGSPEFSFDLVMIEAGYDTPDRFHQMFPWGNNNIPEIKAFGWPARALIPDATMKQAMSAAHSNKTGIVAFPTQALSMGQSIRWEKNIPYIGCVTWNGAPTKRLEADQHVRAMLFVALRKVSNDRVYLDLGFGYRNSLAVFDDKNQQWGTVAYRSFGVERTGVVLPLDQWLMTMMLLVEKEQGNAQYIGLRVRPAGPTAIEAVRGVTR